jgi:transcription antitermination factor NusG
VTKKALAEVGETIEVLDGPFQDFEGTVAELKPREGKVRC